jgi:hypothetical protein
MAVGEVQGRASWVGADSSAECLPSRRDRIEADTIELETWLATSKGFGKHSDLNIA